MRIVRTDLMSKSHFSTAYEVTRTRIDKLIAADRLPVECIDGTDYINITDNEMIMDTLHSKGIGSGNYQRNSVVKPYVPKNEADVQFERDWLASIK